MYAQPFLHSQIYTEYGIPDHDQGEKVGRCRRLHMFQRVHLDFARDDVFDLAFDTEVLCRQHWRKCGVERHKKYTVSI